MNRLSESLRRQKEEKSLEESAGKTPVLVIRQTGKTTRGGMMTSLTLVANRKKTGIDQATSAEIPVDKKQYAAMDRELITAAIGRVMSNMQDIRQLLFYLRGGTSDPPRRLVPKFQQQKMEKAFQLIDFLCEEVYVEQGKLLRAIPPQQKRNSFSQNSADSKGREADHVG